MSNRDSSPSPNKTSMKNLKERILGRFGQDVLQDEVAGTLLIHLDEPDESERDRRRQEVEKGLLLEDDCLLCKDLASHPPEVVIYDHDSVLYLGQDQLGSFASGKPREPEHAKDS